MTAASHPLLFDAFEAISHDCGYGAGHASYSVPPERVGQLADAERALGDLSPAEREEMTIGDSTEFMAGRLADPSLLGLDQLLHAFWEDWE